MQWFRTELNFVTWDQSPFRFRGPELSQEYNRKSIKISMSKFAENVHTQFRGGVGQLQWLQLQGHPLLSFATGILQKQLRDSQRS